MHQGIDYELSAPLAEAINLGLFVSVCTVQQATNTLDTLGQVDLTPSGFSNIAGVVNVACMRAPLAFGPRFASDELKGQTVTEALGLFHVLLNGYYPQIPEPLPSRAQLRALIDGVAHEVMAVESNSQKGMTRLKVRQVGV